MKTQGNALCQPRNAWGYQKLERHRRILRHSLQKEPTLPMHSAAPQHQPVSLSGTKDPPWLAPSSLLNLNPHDFPTQTFWLAFLQSDGLPANPHLEDGSPPLFGIFPIDCYALPTSLPFKSYTFFMAHVFFSPLNHHCTYHLYHVSWHFLMSCSHSSLMVSCVILFLGLELNFNLYWKPFFQIPS